MGVPHEKVYGLAAARAVFERRPEDVLRIAHARELRGELGELLREAAARRIAYEERSAEDLERIAGAVHHEGICLAVAPRRVASEEALVVALREGRCRAVIALDDVSNPHNVGAIVRTAAFFGIDGLLVPGDADRPPLSPAAVRIAQGGAEHVRIARTPALAPALLRIADVGVRIVGSDTQGARPLGALRWPARVVIVLGSEGEGMRDEVREACTDLVTIPGSGAVESLNVSVAAGVVMASWAATREPA